MVIDAGTLLLEMLLLLTVSLFVDDLPPGGTDIDIQLLEAAKAGDLEVVKVTNISVPQLETFELRCSLNYMQP